MSVEEFLMFLIKISAVCKALQSDDRLAGGYNQCWNEYSNDSNIRIKVSESLDSDLDSGLLQILNKIQIFELKVLNIPPYPLFQMKRI